MKIIIPDLNLPYFYNMAGCLQSIVSNPGIEIELMLWNPQMKPIIDVFDERSPDIIFMHEQLLNPAFNVMLQEFDCRYILAAGKPYPELHRQPDVILTNESSLPNFSSSDKIALTTPAADVSSTHNAQKDERLSSDVLVITHSNMQLDDNMLFMMDYLCSTYRTKIVGDTAVNGPHYLGRINPIERIGFIKSSKLLIDFGSSEFLDASFVKTPSLLYGPLANSKFKRFQTLKELKEHADQLLEDEELRKEYANQCYQQIIQEGLTYHNQCSNLFTLLEEPHIARALLDTLKELTS